MSLLGQLPGFNFKFIPAETIQNNCSLCDCGLVDNTNPRCINFGKSLLQKADKNGKSVIRLCPYRLRVGMMPLRGNGASQGVIVGGYTMDSPPGENVKNIPLPEKKEEISQVPVLTPALFRNLMNHIKKLIDYTTADQPIITPVLLEPVISIKPYRPLSEVVDELEHVLPRICEVDLVTILLPDFRRDDYPLLTSQRFLEKDLPVVAEDCINDERFPQDWVKKERVKSTLIVPIFIPGKENAVMLLSSRKKFEDIPLKKHQIKVLATHISHLISGSLLFREFIAKQLEASQVSRQMEFHTMEVGKAFSIPEKIDELLVRIAEACLNLSGMDAVSVSLLHDRRLETRVELGFSFSTPHSPVLRMRESLVGWQNTFDHPAFPVRDRLYDDLIFDKRSSREGTLRYLGIPLGIENDLVGVINLYGYRNLPVDKPNMSLIMAFAQLAAAAIRNANILEKEKTRAEESWTLWKAAMDIAQSNNVKDILDQSLKSLTAVAEVDRCIILFVDEKKRNMRATAGIGLSHEQREFFSYLRLPLKGIAPSLWEDLLHGRPLVFSGIPPESPSFEELFNLLPTSSCLLIPMIWKNKVFGIIFLDEKSATHNFTDVQVAMASALGDQITSSIMRAREYQQINDEQTRLSTLYSMSLTLGGTLSLPRIFKNIAEKSRLIMREAVTAVSDWDETRKSFRLAASENVSKEKLDNDVLDVLSRMVARRKRALSISLGDPASGEKLEEMLGKINAGGVFMVPLIAKRKVEGVLHCFYPERRKFAPENIQTLRSFAGQAALAIQNARVYGVMKSKVHELATLFEVGKAVNSSLQLETVLTQIAQNVRKVMNSDACVIKLLDENGISLNVAINLGLSKNYDDNVKHANQELLFRPLRTGRPVHLLDNGPGSEFPELLRSEGIQTYISIPMISRDKPLGKLNIYFHDKRFLPDSDIKLLQTIGQQAAMAIEKANLYSEQEKIGTMLRDILTPGSGLGAPGMDISHFYIPSLQLSGDYYDLIGLDPGCVAITIADVAGKGPDAATYALRAKYILRALARSNLQPADLLSRMNLLISEEAESEKFISLFYGFLDLKRGKMSYASAGHEPPIYYSRKRKKIYYLKSEGVLLGVFERILYKQKARNIYPGDFMVLYTDGITEARSPGGEIYGGERLAGVILENSDNNAASLANRVYNDVKKFTRSTLHDDFSLMVVKFLPWEE
ncbi:MAG: SpoIIE family protein phosphatase [Chloroflexi bacterium]|nr:SpoIIE family protein phosphatase [Chloroflexota bacterium]